MFSVRNLPRKTHFSVRNLLRKKNLIMWSTILDQITMFIKFGPGPSPWAPWAQGLMGPWARDPGPRGRVIPAPAQLFDPTIGAALLNHFDLGTRFWYHLLVPLFGSCFQYPPYVSDFGTGSIQPGFYKAWVLYSPGSI